MLRYKSVYYSLLSIYILQHILFFDFCASDTIDPHQINDYFTRIATDPNYSCDNVIKGALQAPHRSTNHKYVNYTRDHVELMLARISMTSSGNDNTPY